MNKESFIKSTPYCITSFLVNIKGWVESNKKFGSIFKIYLEQFTSADNYEVKKIDVGHVKKCIASIPYYKNYHDINTFEELPIISKKEILEDIDLFINKKIKKQQNLNTSGSTGSAFVFPITEEFFNKKFAAVWYFRNSHKLFKEKKNANLIGRVFLPIEKKKPPYWVDVKSTNQLLLSQYHLSEDTIQYYLKAIIKHDIKWLHGYPSTLTLLAQYGQEYPNLLDEIHLEAITCSSETLLDKQRILIEDTFKTKVLNFYGQAEGVADIYQCEEGSLHINEDYSYVELIKDEKTSYYKIVGTQLSNLIMPFVRYDTGDLVELPQEGFQCKCGRKSRVIKKIIGRKEDNIYLADGRQIGRLDHLFKSTQGILEAQIHQFEKGSAEFWLVKSDKFYKDDEKSLKQEIENKLGKDFKYSIKYKREIPRTKAGKLKAVISHIK